MARVFIFICLFLSWVSKSFSQELGTHWICYPTPNDSSEVLFCHTYTTPFWPQRAFVSFASTGRVRVYVNERNITRDICFCNPDTTTIAVKTYDITRFLRPDGNTIAVWYAPVQGQPISKQLSLEYYGTDSRGRDFYRKADGSWKCTQLEGCFTKNNKEEYFDASQYDNNWKAADHSRRGWLHPLGAYADAKSLSLSCDMSPKASNRLRNILLPSGTFPTTEGMSCVFGYPFNGTIRVTLRNTKKGGILKIGNLNYTCSGELDEQAFMRFLTSNDREFPIIESNQLKHVQIVNIEGLEYE